MCPYLKYYTDIFELIKVDYEFICWDRYTNSNNYNNRKSHCFTLYSPYSNHFFKKLFGYGLFSRFVINCIKREGYDLLLVHSLVNAVFLKRFLLKSYKNRFIYDIRDYSPIFPFFKRSIKEIIAHSAITTISSFGFLQWLPKGFEYVIGHNIGKQEVISALKGEKSNHIENKNDIKVLTIGQIRHYLTNVRLLSSLGNQPGISLIFAGWGFETDRLEEFALNRFSNVLFTGKYDKQHEWSIVDSSDILNVILPSIFFERTLISNRFYLSLVYKKPMIVNEESVQADLVKKYNLGFVVKSTDNIKEKLLDYLKDFDAIAFDENCNNLLRLIKKDIEKFELKIISLCKNGN